MLSLHPRNNIKMMFPCLTATVLKSSTLFAHDTVRNVYMVPLPLAYQRWSFGLFPSKKYV